MKPISVCSTLLFLLFISFSVKAQTHKWSLGAGDDFLNETRALTSDKSGNVYAAGQFITDINLNTSSPSDRLTGNGFFSVFIAKFNPEGKHTWSGKIGSNSVTEIKAMGIDGNGNIYITGIYTGNCNFKLRGSTNTFLQSTGIGRDVFLAKYDSDGKVIWAKNIASVGSAEVKGISIKTDGGIYITGNIKDTTDFDPSAAKALMNPLKRNINDVYIAHYNTDGNYVWAKQIGGVDRDNVTGICSDSKDNVYLTGGFEGSADFDPSAAVRTLTASGQQDIFLAAYDKSGKHLWSNKMGGIGDETGKTLSTDNTFLYLGGDFEGLIDLNPSSSNFLLTSAGGTDIFIARYDITTGAFSWGKQAGGPGEDICNSLVNDGKFNLYLSGSYENSAVFDGKTTLASAGVSDMYIATYSLTGSFNKIITTGGTENDYGTCLNLDNTTHLFAGGAYHDTVDFNPSPNRSILQSFGDEDVFIVAYNLDCTPPEAPKTSTDKVTLCFNSAIEVSATGKGNISWHSAAEGGILLKKGKTLQTSNLVSGMSVFAQDSTCEAGPRTEIIIQVDAAIDTGVSININTLRAEQAGADYQWLDCDKNRQTIPGANQRSFTPSASGNYAVIITVNSCSVVSACKSLSLLGLDEIRQSSLLLYPNPVRNTLNIEYPGYYKAQLYSTDGRLLAEIQSESSADFNMAEYPSGLYFLQIHNDKGLVQSRKFLKE